MKPITYLILSILLFAGTAVANCLTVEIKGNGQDDDCNPATLDSSGYELHKRMRTAGGFTEYTDVTFAAGRIIDQVDFGHRNWSSASGDNVDPNGDADDISDSMGAHRVEASTVTTYRVGSNNTWVMNVPAPGYYVFATHAWNREGRAQEPYYIVGNTRINLETEDTFKSQYWILEFPAAGEYQFGTGRANYLFHAILYAMRPACSERSDTGEHPIMIPNIERLRAPQLSAWAERMRADVINDSRNRANSIETNGPGYYQGCDARGIQGALFDLAAGYAVHQEARVATAGITALEAIGDRPHIQCGPVWSSLEKGEIARGTALAYDVFAPAMSTEKRQEVACKIERHLNFLAKHAQFSRHRGDNEYWYAAPTTNNWGLVVSSGGVGTAGLALKSFAPDSENWIELGKESARFGLDAFNLNGWFTEGFTYGSYAMSSLVPFIDGLQEEKHQAFVSEMTGYLKRAAEVTLYNTDSKMWGVSPFSHISSYFAPPSRYRYTLLFPYVAWAGGVTGDGVIENYLNRRYGYRGTDEEDSAEVRLHDYSAALPASFLAYRPVTEIPANEWALPEKRFFPGAFSVSRFGGWGSRQSALLSVLGESVNSGGHREKEQGGFFYEASGQPLIASASRGASSLRNVVTIDDQDQKAINGRKINGIVGFLPTVFGEFTTVELLEQYQNDANTLQKAQRTFFFPRKNSEKQDSHSYLLIADSFEDSTPRTYRFNFNKAPGRYRFQILDGKTVYGESASTEGVDDNIDETDFRVFFESLETSSANAQSSGDRLSFTPTPNQEHFTSLTLVTTDKPGQAMPTRIRTAGLVGYNFAGDTALISSGEGVRSYEGLETDAELFIFSHGSASLSEWKWGALSNMTSFSSTDIHLSANTPTSLVLERDRGLLIHSGNEAGGSGTLALSLVSDTPLDIRVGAGATTRVSPNNGLVTWSVPTTPTTTLISGIAGAPLAPQSLRLRHQSE